jgi:AAA+ ATPase superfamily predicted ATPase
MKPLLISTGRAADGEDKYFERKSIENKIWSKIKQKEDLLLAAPRRTGKSSILKYLERNPREGYLIKYKSVQSVDSINEYFKQIYKLLLEDDSIFSSYERHYKIAKGAVKSFASRIRGISTEGIEINPEEHVDYYNECKILLKTLPPDFNH